MAVTGGFATGKTTIASLLRGYGAKVVDADKIAHGLIKPGTSAYKKVVALFGRGIVQKDKSIDRGKLSQIVFSNPRLLNRLNSIVHPGVVKAIKKEAKTGRQKVAVLDIPLLFESGLQQLADKVIVVTADRKAQVKRAQKRKASLSGKDILMRIKAQMPLTAKVRKADFVIDNSGTREQTKKQVENLLSLL